MVYGRGPVSSLTRSRSSHASERLKTDTSSETGKLRILVALRETPEALFDILMKHESDILTPGELDTSLIAQKGYNIILIDNEADALVNIKAADPRAEIILFGESDDEAVEAVSKGASAFFRKPPDLDLLAKSIGVISEIFARRRETAQLEKLLQAQYTVTGVVGKNPQMLEIINFMRRIAPYYKTVTVTGETGTGKEVMARALHSLSPKSGSPFITCNCGALVEGLIESELFGHRKGAFTGAINDRVGLFEAAGDGTLFLDEIGLLPLSFQPHLLRVLQDGEFRRIGSSQSSKARCRVIAATNKDLAVEVRAGAFRDDLFYRLASLTIHLPPLRERKDDIPLLARHFLDRFGKRTGKNISGISRPAQCSMISYDWPGNIRELEGAIEQAAIVTNEAFIELCCLPHAVREAPKRRTGLRPESLDRIVRNHIDDVLCHCNGNRTQAAKLLGISRRALQRRLEKQPKYITPPVSAHPAKSAHRILEVS